MPVSKFSIPETVKVSGFPTKVTHTSKYPREQNWASRAQPSKDRGHPLTQPQSLKDTTQSAGS